MRVCAERAGDSVLCRSSGVRDRSRACPGQSEGAAAADARACQMKALKAAAPKPAPTPSRPGPAAHEVGSKRPREEPAAALPSGFFDSDGAPAASRPPEVDPPQAGAACAQEPAAAEPQKQPGRTAAGAGGGGLCLELAYGSSSEEESEEEEEPATLAAPGAQPAVAVAAGAAALPEGFFDDRAKDAIAHNKPAPKKLDIDEVLHARPSRTRRALHLPVRSAWPL